MTESAQGNLLYYGDNLDILRRYIKPETVDLIYLDPPFKSNQDYNVLFEERNGSQSAAQIKAFEDTWRWDQAAAGAYQETVEAGGQASRAMQAFRAYLGENDMMAYLAMMAPRLIELHRVLKPTGSIYLHCDPTASHYLKMLVDAVFGPGSFVNEIVWHHGLGAFQKQQGFPSKHDVLLYYAKSRSFIFHKLRGEVTRQMLAKYCHEDEHGERYMMSYGRRYYLKGGKPYDDVWDIATMSPTAKERLGYPTQKPEALLERVIMASSNEGDLVLDPFCGCGTTIAVAQRLERRWVGIDITCLATALIKNRLRCAFGDGIVETFRTIGEPTSLPDAETLAAEDPYQFQWWALGLVGARPVEQKKGSDKGIDGRLYFHDEAKGGKTKQVILSVKAGHTNVAHLRDLRGVLEREKAELGVLITMQEPTRPMRTEAASAGFYHSPGWEKDYPRLQILSVAQLLEGKTIDMPPLRHVDATFKKAPKVESAPGKQMDLP